MTNRGGGATDVGRRRRTLPHRRGDFIINFSEVVLLSVVNRVLLRCTDHFRVFIIYIRLCKHIVLLCHIYTFAIYMHRMCIFTTIRTCAMVPRLLLLAILLLHLL